MRLSRRRIFSCSFLLSLKKRPTMSPASGEKPANDSIVQVLAPLAVDHREQHLALQLADRLGAELLLAGRVRRLRVVLELLGQEVMVDRTTLAAGLLDDVFDGDADRVEPLQAGPQLIEVRVLGVPVGRRRL